MEESETLISEREIPRLLGEYQAFAVNCILNKQYQQGLEVLMRSQELIQAAITQDAMVSIELIILTEHTFAFYYHCTEDVNSKVLALNKTISLFKKYIKSLPKTLNSKASHRILKSRILLKLHLQMFGGYSKQQNFDSALAHGQAALRRSQSIVHNTLKACQEHLYRHKAMSISPAKNQQYALLDSPHYQMFHNLVLKAMPILLYLDEKQTAHTKVQISNVPDVNFEELTQVQPLDFENLIHGPEIMEELERDFMLEKIIYSIATHFFVGSHLRKLPTEENLIESKILIRRAWKVARSFLPPESQIYISVQSVWEKTKHIGRVRSISRIRPSAKVLKSEARSASSNKFRNSPSKKLNDTNKELSSKQSESLTPLRRKIIGKFKKMKAK